MQHKGFYLTCPIKRKMLIFRNNKKKSSWVEQVEDWSWKYWSRQRYPVRVYWLFFLNLTLACTAFVNSTYPENWALLYKALIMLATEKNECCQGNCTSLQTLNKKFLSTFNFVPKVNEFLSKLSPIKHSFVKHKRH